MQSYPAIYNVNNVIRVIKAVTAGGTDYRHNAPICPLMPNPAVTVTLFCKNVDFLKKMVGIFFCERAWTHAAIDQFREWFFTFLVRRAIFNEIF